MMRQILLGGATAILVTGSASALTMNITSDSRSIDAFAEAGGDSDSASDSASGGTFDSNVNASASAGSVLTFSGGSGGGGGGNFGAVANSSAGQFSEIDAASLTISASGYADASGNHGDITPGIVSEADGAGGGGGGLFFGDFRADSRSYMEIMFSIDEDVSFDISGFLSAGNEIAVGGEGSDISNEASIILVNTDTNVSAFKTSVSNDSTSLDEQGVIGAGNYRFMVEASTEVNGFVRDELVSSINGNNGFGYATSAGYKGISLDLAAVDQPIPEPVTTTLAAMGLGALVLRTSRRRHS